MDDSISMKVFMALGFFTVETVHRKKKKKPTQT